MRNQSNRMPMVNRRSILTGSAGAVFAAFAMPALARRADESKVTIASFELLRPSQGAVGMREVAIKTADVIDRARKPEKLAKFLLKEALPVVRGPDGGLHLIDHHHLGRALWEAKHRDAHVETMADLSKLAADTFWAEMDKRGWLHAYDATGKFVGPDKLPRHLKDMGDDIYRSLAGAIRDAGAYEKSQVPFAEFKWADFLRTHIIRSAVDRNFDAAVAQAKLLARTPEAATLPGFLGAKKKAA